MGMNPMPPATEEAIIALGGNLGDILGSFLGARDMLAAHSDIDLSASSMLYRSPPMGPQDQADYLNAVISVSTSLSPLDLLHCLQDIEHHFGRRRDGVRWGERTLDLDLVAHDDTRMQSHTLTLPHPGMQERMFVLQPLCDIRPGWRHPIIGKTARELLQQRLDAGDTLLAGGKPW